MKRLLTCIAVAIWALSAPVGAEEASQIPFTADQVERGADVYFDFCLMCHGQNLSDGQFGAPIKGSFFRQRWNGKTVAEIFQFMQETMPPSDPGYLYPEEYADVLAYVFAANGLDAGDTELPSEIGALEALVFQW